MTVSTFVAWLPWAWIVGAPITFGWLAMGITGSERLRRKSTRLESGAIVDACQRLRSAMGVARGVSVAVCAGLGQPVLVGIVRPMILLPAAALSGWTPAELEMVLTHELAHVRRWDNLVNLVQRIVESLLFFHPAVWLVSRKIRLDREECCDAAVVARTQQPQRYAELLVSIAATLRRGQAPPLAAASAMADHPLAGRIRRILNVEDEPMWVSRKTLSLTLALPLLLVGLTLYAADPAKPQAAHPAENPPPSKGGARGGIEAKTETAEGNRIIAKVYPVGDLETVRFHEWMKLIASDKRIGIQWFDDNRSIVVNAPESSHEEIADFFSNTRGDASRAQGGPVEVEERLSISNPPARPEVRAYGEWPGEAALKDHFTESDENPSQTTTYSAAKLPLADLAGQLDELFEGLQKDPYGPQLEFDFQAIDEGKKYRITAPADAHREVFAPLFAGDVWIGSRPENAAAASEPEAPDENDFRARNQQIEALAKPGQITAAVIEHPASFKEVEARLKELNSLGHNVTIRAAKDFTVLFIDPPPADDKAPPELGEPNAAGRPLRPGDKIVIKVAGAFPEHPIDDAFKVEAAGTVALGPTYGRVDVAGQTVLQAQASVETHLQKILSDAEVQITLWEQGAEPAAGDQSATYLYDGRTFQQWRSLWKHELKTERRIEAINALAAFARAGQGREAAEAILDVAGQYDFSAVAGEGVEGELMQRVMQALIPRAGSGIAPADWLPALMQRLAQDPDKWRPLTQMLLGNFYQMGLRTLEPATRELLLQMVQEPKYGLKADALYALWHGTPEDDAEVRRLVKQSLAGENVAHALAVLRSVGFRQLDELPEQFDLLFHDDPAVRRTARTVLAGSSRPVRPAVAERLLAVLDDAARGDDHADAIRALGALLKAYDTASGAATRKAIFDRLDQTVGEGPAELVAPALVTMGISTTNDIDNVIESEKWDKSEEYTERVKQARDEIEAEVERVVDPPAKPGEGYGLDR